MFIILEFTLAAEAAIEKIIRLEFGRGGGLANAPVFHKIA